MKNKIFNLFRKLLLSFILLYGFNTVGSNFNLVIPINMITLLLITLLGFPALFSLVLLFVLAFWGDKDVRIIYGQATFVLWRGY